MAQVIVTESSLENIASAIRSKLNTQDTYKPSEMAGAISQIHGDPVLEALDVRANGTYTPSSGKDGFSQAVVNVPNSYTTSDEGKVVSGGALVAQSSQSITQNGTYDTTLKNQVVVNVSGGGGGILTGTTPPTSDMGSDGDYYKQTFTLPSNVNFVEYLQSSGTQYINTGIIGNQTHKCKVVFKRLGNNYGPFGAYSSTTSRFLGVVCSGNGFRPGYGSISFEISDTSATIHTVDIGNKVFEIDGSQNPTFTTPNALILFGNYVGSTINKGANVIYRVVIFANGVPVADYLPCLDGNGVACMWDNVAKEYVYNDGTGDFTYGSTDTPTELDPILYVKENGAWRVVGQ